MNRIPSAKELVEFAATMGARLFDQDGAVQPIWHIVRSNGDHRVIGLSLEDGAQKDMVAAAMRKVFEELDAVAYVFVCESWVLFSADLLDVRREGIAEHPKRQECIWYAAEDAMGSLSACQMIERQEGEKARLAPLKWMENAARSEGRFIGMLPVKGRVH